MAQIRADPLIRTLSAEKGGQAWVLHPRIAWRGASSWSGSGEACPHARSHVLHPFHTNPPCKRFRITVDPGPAPAPRSHARSHCVHTFHTTMRRTCGSLSCTSASSCRARSTNPPPSISTSGEYPPTHAPTNPPSHHYYNRGPWGAASTTGAFLRPHRPPPTSPPPQTPHTRMMWHRTCTVVGNPGNPGHPPHPRVRFLGSLVSFFLLKHQTWTSTPTLDNIHPAPASGATCCGTRP